MESIKIVRLKEGCDIICLISLVKGEYFVKNPMVIDLHYSKASRPELIMSNWLPVQLIKDNEAFISVDEVMCLLEPNDYLTEYYRNLVDRATKFVAEEPQESSQEELEELAMALFELENAKGLLIH
jgi:hypothetical protein